MMDLLGLICTDLNVFLMLNKKGDQNLSFNRLKFNKGKDKFAFDRFMCEHGK